MPRVELENVRLAKTFMSGEVMVGIPNKDNLSFKHKANVHSDFLKCVIEVFYGHEIEIVTGSKKYLVEVREV